MAALGRRAWLYRGVWGGTTLWVLWWTLLPFRHDGSSVSLARAVADIQWIPFVERGRAPLWSDLVGNLALFTPFGLAGWRVLERRRHRLLVVLAAAAALSLGVETLQLTIPARRTSVTDLVADVFGAALGAIVGRFWELRLRTAFRRWMGALVVGDPGPLLFSCFVGGMILWALAPGVSPPADLWTQVQILSSSFRRFPGWEAWLVRSTPLVVLGACGGALACRSSRAPWPGRLAFGVGAVAVFGVVSQIVCLVVPTRQPDIFRALALGAGGLPGAVMGLGGYGPGALLAGVAAGVALFGPPGPGVPYGITRVALLFGAGLVVVGAGKGRSRW